MIAMPGQLTQWGIESSAPGTSTVADELLMTNPRRAASDATARWDEVLDLIATRWHPGRAGTAAELDDGLTPPSPIAVAIATSLAEALRDQNVVPPTRLFADGDGGIVFERRDGELLQLATIRPDGTLDFATYERGILMERLVQRLGEWG